MSAVFTVVAIVAALYWLTLAPEPPQQESCANTLDLSAAAIATEGQDQQNLVDSAMLARGKCGEAAKADPADESRP